jgi:hypothetical protein
MTFSVWLLLPQFNRACVRPASGHGGSQRVEWYSTPHTGNCQQNLTRKLSLPQQSIPILVLRFGSVVDEMQDFSQHVKVRLMWIFPLS